MESTASAVNTGPERNEQLVSIQIDREFDLFAKDWREKVYVKLFVAARTSGLLAAISDREWKTLTTMATFMDKDGHCYPSQTSIARSLRISRASANVRVRALANFRFQGKPVLLVEKRVRMSKRGHRFASNSYRIMPVTRLRIFDTNDKSD